MLKLAIASALFLCSVGAAAAEPVSVVSEGPLTLSSMRQMVVHSEKLDRDFQLRISPPLIPPAPGQKPAIVYLLDANALFGMAADTFRFQTLEGKSWPTYIVAIGYDTTNPQVVMKTRETDFLHAKFEAPGRPPIGGGGGAFESFLIDELKPFVEARLGGDPNNSILAGVSYGGLFAANVLVTRPDAFSGYLIGSPSLWADDALLAKARAVKGGNNRKVFIGVGEKEIDGPINMVRDADALAAALSKRGSGLLVEQRVYAGQVHGAVPGPVLADGFRYLLTRP
jgi:predicted alpha/beta superfamily hydrolase